MALYNSQFKLFVISLIEMKEDKKTNHSFFEWIQLCISISIPVTIAVYTILENKRELAIATRNRAQDLDIAYNQQQDLIFQECLTTLGKLIEKYGQELNESSSASLVARFATLSALHRLDRNRRNSLVRLLYESKLITYRSGDYQPPILLYSTNLTDLNLHDGSDQGVFFHLSLEDTIMTKADFHESHIPGARFNKAILIHANPSRLSLTKSPGSRLKNAKSQGIPVVSPRGVARELHILETP
jgi:uncharacterized protein YjbI with pentapeptide repeats